MQPASPDITIIRRVGGDLAIEESETKCALSRFQYKLFCTACRINKDHNTSLMTGERGSLKSVPHNVAHRNIIIFNKKTISESDIILCLV